SIVYKGRKRWVTQTPIEYADATLVEDVWETVVADLSEGEPGRFWYVVIYQSNTGAAGEDFELEFNFGDAVRTLAVNLADDTPFYVYENYALLGGEMLLEINIAGTFGDAYGEGLAIPFSFDRCGLIRVRQTSNVDGGAAEVAITIIWDKFTEA
ncbi:unnamed protein product, partial [marine sediment metagenome]